MTGVTVKVEGLRATAQNLLVFNQRIQKNIGRTALRAAANTLGKRIKADSGTTYKSITGMVKRGFSTGIAKVQPGEIQYASVYQRKQNISTKTAAGKLAAHKLTRRGKAAPPKKALAYWWRFLEFGTKPRKRGSGPPLPWIEPAAKAVAGQAVEAFRDNMRRRIDQESSSLPTTRGKS